MTKQAHQRCKILSTSTAPNNDVIIRVEYKELAESVLPGQYVHLSIDESIEQGCIAYVMGVDQKQAQVSLYLSALNSINLDLSQKNQLWISLAKGEAFPQPEFSNLLLILADELGLASVIFLSQFLSAGKTQSRALVFLYSESQFPFSAQPSRFLVPNMLPGVIAACPLLEDRKIPSRLASSEFLPGCYQGSITEFIHEWDSDYINDKDMTILISGQSTFVRSLELLSDEFKGKKHVVELPVC